jgi:phenylacetic acid degradation operon negative regulatory protein
MPVSALVAAGPLFDVGEASVRVAVARLLAAGRIERDERGRYRLGAGAAPIDRRIQSWRRLGERTRAWDGSWVGVLLQAGSRKGSRADRRRGERALGLLGFRELSSGLLVRPDNLEGGVAAIRSGLHDLGFDRSAPVFRLEGLDVETDAAARRLWDDESLGAGYERSLADLARSERDLETLPEGEAMVESYLLGGRVLRQLVLDPVLPDPLAPAATRRALVLAMRRYDRQGRALWSRFLASHGAPHARAQRTPVDGPTRATLH